MSELPTLGKPQQGSDFYIGLMFFICLLMLLAYGVFKLNVWLEDEQQAPVQDIIVSGDKTFIDVQQIQMLIKLIKQLNLCHGYTELQYENAGLVA